MHFLYLAAAALGVLAVVLLVAAFTARWRGRAPGARPEDARRYAAGAQGGDAEGRGEDAS